MYPDHAEVEKAVQAYVEEALPLLKGLERNPLTLLGQAIARTDNASAKRFIRVRVGLLCWVSVSGEASVLSTGHVAAPTDDDQAQRQPYARHGADGAVPAHVRLTDHGTGAADGGGSAQGAFKGWVRRDGCGVARTKSPTGLLSRLVPDALPGMSVRIRSRDSGYTTDIARASPNAN